MKHIDADKLKAVLKARIEAGLDAYGGNLKWLLKSIDSLQQEQPNADIRSELEKYIFSISVETMGKEPFTQLEKCALYFYELGLNARKEECYEIH